MTFRARIVRGYGRGKRIGFPTLNLLAPQDFPYPRGIYAGLVWIGKKRHVSAIHYGPIPTFGLREATLEAFLLDASLRAVPRTVAVELIAWLRPVRRFANAQALARQIARDVRAVHSIMS